MPDYDDIADNDEQDDDGPAIEPGDPDYDLSEEHGYRWEPARENWPVPGWLLAGVSLLVAAALVVPGVIFLLQHS